MFRGHVALVLFALGAFAASPGDLRAQNPTARIMELNRTGRWTEASELAGQLLRDSIPIHQTAQRCELAVLLAYASLRLQQMQESRAALADAEDLCAGFESSWTRAEIGRIRAELESHKSGYAVSQRGKANESDEFWQSADPATMGLNAPALDRHRDLCESTGANACLVVYRGKIVQEWYSSRYQEPAYAMSTTKSVAGILFGMLLDEGRITSVDQPVCDFVLEWCEGLRGRVTLRHLLSMTSGLPRYEDRSVGFVSDKNTFVIGLTPTAEPGTKWAYSNEGVQLLSPIMDEAAGELIQRYAQRRLFEPLGMRHSRLHLDSFGHAWTYADMETTPRDLARLGLLLLNGGEWEGRRIVSREWIERSTRPSQQINPGYGLLWWLHEDPVGFAGHGHLDTHLHIFPGLEIVVVRMQSKPFPGVSEGMYERTAVPLFREFVQQRRE